MGEDVGILNVLRSVDFLNASGHGGESESNVVVFLID